MTSLRENAIEILEKYGIKFSKKDNTTRLCTVLRKNQNEINWYRISECQKLSESFIKKFQDKLSLERILECQKLSENFIRELNLTVPVNNWLYKSKQFKLDYIKKNTKFKIVNNSIIAYKSCMSNGCSVFDFQYKYETGLTYESACDCNSDHLSSLGLYSWTKKKALKYYNKGILFKVKIDLDDLGCITKEGKIRCFRLTVLEKVE